MEITENMEETLEKNKLRGTLFIDIKKAYDTVNHDILLAKLEKLGLEERQINS